MAKNFTMLIALLTVVALTMGVIGSAAYTSLTLDREATVDVVADDNGIVELSPGPVSFVDVQDDQLVIDVTNGGAEGVNVNSQLEMGDSESPTTVEAFAVTNNDNEERTMNFDYVLDDDNGVSSESITFEVYDSEEILEDSFSNTEEAEVTFESGETHYVVITVDTEGLTPSEDLSGTVSVLSG